MENIPEKVGRYEIRSELGRGGMATVYLGFDPKTQREVAIKLLPPIVLQDPKFRARFEREAHTIAQLEHPAIVPLYDYGEDNGQLYFVMRRMSGGSLTDRIKNGPILPGDVSNIIQRIARGLDQAHAKGFIHRDLKPDNILFDEYGDAYISDFGIAKLTEGGGTMTGTGIIGTPAYMSPEQARGDSGIDGQSDIYSLGAIVYEMLTGKLPYAADTPMGIAFKHVTEPVPRILEANPSLPAACAQVIDRAMAKDKTARYATAKELAAALAAAVGGRSPTSSQELERVAVPGGAAYKPAAKGRGIPVWVWAVGGIAILVLCLIISAVAGGTLLVAFSGGSPPTANATLTAEVQAPQAAETVTAQVIATIEPGLKRTESALKTASAPTATATETPMATATESPTATPKPTSSGSGGGQATVTLKECRGYDGTVFFGQSSPNSIHAFDSVSYTVPAGSYALRIDWLGHSEVNVNTTIQVRAGSQVLPFGDQCR